MSNCENNIDKSLKTKNTKKLKNKKLEQPNECIDINSNIFRKLSNHLNNFFNLKNLKGTLYYNLHLYLIYTIGFIIVFSTSINVLAIILLIVSLDALSVVVLHECPLTTMERNYLGFTSCDIRNDCLKNAGIMYNCDHNYEKQIELLINIWCLITAKCLTIMFLNMFNIKLFDVSNIFIKKIEIPT